MDVFVHVKDRLPGDEEILRGSVRSAQHLQRSVELAHCQHSGVSPAPDGRTRGLPWACRFSPYRIDTRGDSLKREGPRVRLAWRRAPTDIAPPAPRAS